MRQQLRPGRPMLGSKLFPSLLCLTLASCAQPKPAPPPPPPAIERKTSYPQQAARPGDMVIKNCTVVREDGNKADCVCRKASTKIDVNDPGKQMMVCK
jgi:hypothetical protein